MWGLYYHLYIKLFASPFPNIYALLPRFKAIFFDILVLYNAV